VARRRTFRRLGVVTGLAFAVIVATPAIASAHPLGNFTVNRYAGVRVGRDYVDVDYVVDMAEIPTFQTKPGIDRNGDGRIDRRESAAYMRGECARLARGVHVTVGNDAFMLASTGGALSFPPGQAGLPTLRLECRLHGATPAASAGVHTLRVHDTNLTERIGWREMTAVGDGTRLRPGALPTTSISARLTNYPKDRLRSPPDVRDATLSYSAGGSRAPALTPPVESPSASVVRGFDSFTRSFTASVAARRLTLGLALVALAIGMGLGALHAFAPGHGKTVMAAYLVGERGTVRDGLLIGVTVAATHTVGVLVLGLFLSLSETFAPESIYPWLALASGVCFGVLGITLLWGALRRRRGLTTRAWLTHTHGRDHTHPHTHDHDHSHDHDHTHDTDATPLLSRRRLVTLGFAGGMVPTPTAVVVLLGATAIGRAWFGVALVVAYGVGMAATLVSAGLLLSRARRTFEVRARSERLLRVATILPIATALVVTGSGLWLIARAASSV
jgi:ABC-type nickel/cobalt efflux system permease component RcnA